MCVRIAASVCLSCCICAFASVAAWDCLGICLCRRLQSLLVSDLHGLRDLPVSTPVTRFVTMPVTITCRLGYIHPPASASALTYLEGEPDVASPPCSLPCPLLSSRAPSPSLLSLTHLLPSGALPHVVARRAQVKNMGWVFLAMPVMTDIIIIILCSVILNNVSRDRAYPVFW